MIIAEHPYKRRLLRQPFVFIPCVVGLLFGYSLIASEEAPPGADVVGLLIVVFLFVVATVAGIARLRISIEKDALVIEDFLLGWRRLRRRFRFDQILAVYAGVERTAGPFAFLALTTDQPSKTSTTERESVVPVGRLNDDLVLPADVQAQAAILKRLAGQVGLRRLARPTNIELIFAAGASVANRAISSVTGRAIKLRYPLHYVYLPLGLDEQFITAQLESGQPIRVGRHWFGTAYLVTTPTIGQRVPKWVVLTFVLVLMMLVVTFLRQQG